MEIAEDDAKQHLHHDTHALPPFFIQRAYSYYQKVKREDLDNDPHVIDFGRGLNEAQREFLRPARTISASTIEAACVSYRIAAKTAGGDGAPLEAQVKDVTVYEHRDFPGLQILPSLLPPETQILFTSQLMHRDLANQTHKINLQPDYTIPYPLSRAPPETDSEFVDGPPPQTAFRSFFTYPQNSELALMPKNPDTHWPLNMAQFLSSKLRWLTLGSQYDWPTRSYDKQDSTVFPPDLSKLVTGLFAHIRPESGVVLIYSSKDYMPVHRDVSEQCERALASFSLGCDGIFVIARGEDDGEGDNRPRTTAIRVRSGDCIHLDGEARWAWHAMARTIPNTCPKFLADWPVGTPGATEEEKRAYQKWKGYMGGKRINISCRQVWD